MGGYLCKCYVFAPSPHLNALGQNAAPAKRKDDRTIHGSANEVHKTYGRKSTPAGAKRFNFFFAPHSVTTSCAVNVRMCVARRSCLLHARTVPSLRPPKARLMNSMSNNYFYDDVHSPPRWSHLDRPRMPWREILGSRNSSTCVTAMYVCVETCNVPQG